MYHFYNVVSHSDNIRKNRRKQRNAKILIYQYVKEITEQFDQRRKLHLAMV